MPLSAVAGRRQTLARAGPAKVAPETQGRQASRTRGAATRDQALRGRSLFLFLAGPANAVDGQRRAARFLGDLAILFEDVAVCGLVAVQAAEQFRRHAPVGTLRPVLIDDVEKGELAFGTGSRM